MMSEYFLYKNGEKIQQKANIFNKISVIMGKKAMSNTVKYLPD
jgi:hypothetical protein